MKRKIIILGIIIFVCLISSFMLILFPTLKNDKYEKKIFEDIKTNTNIENITYVNFDNNYYIIKSDDKIIVLDLNYDEVYTKNSVRESNLPLVYRRNDLYYEERLKKKNKLIYNFYSTDEDTLVFSSSVGGF